MTLRSVPDPKSLGAFGQTLHLGPVAGDHWLPLDPAILVDHVEAYRAHAQIPQLAVAASAWNKHLVKVLLPGPLTLHALHDIELRCTPDNLRVRIEDHLPRTLAILDPTPSDGETPTSSTLFSDVVAPIHAHLADRTGISEQILWGNAGNLLAYVYDKLTEAHPDATGTARDRALLLDADRPPWPAAANPLQDPVRYEALELPGLPSHVQVRRTCCLRHALPDKGPCYTCPKLSTDQRRTHILRLHEAHTNGGERA